MLPILTALEKYYIGIGRGLWQYNSRHINAIKKGEFDRLPEDVREIILRKGESNGR
jgi:hypothetical protein